MGTTANFLKLRSSGTPKTGEWNKNYQEVLELAKQKGKYIITCWSNGDNCGYCTAAEKCMMEKPFTDWQKTADAYFVFQYSGDADKGKTVKSWIYSGTGLRYYPGFRISAYDAKTGQIIKSLDTPIEGNKLRNSKSGAAGAQAMVNNLKAILAKGAPAGGDDTPTPEPATPYKIRLNEKLTVKKVNAILDAIDKNDGYCPCQAGQTADTKCHCKDFKENKKIGEPCICNIYVKQKE